MDTANYVLSKVEHRNRKGRPHCFEPCKKAILEALEMMPPKKLHDAQLRVMYKNGYVSGHTLDMVRNIYAHVGVKEFASLAQRNLLLPAKTKRAPRKGSDSRE